jgi:ubiquinone/menaquinone biosynthesis C-methylase UbiE
MDVKEKTQRAYDKVGEDYDSWYWTAESRRLREGLQARVLKILKKELEGEKRPKILDVCCGTGYLVKDLSSIGEYQGLDFAPHMVMACRKRYPGEKFLVGDAENLPFGPNSFDAVVCFWSFHHLTDPARAIEGFASVLKPGGIVVIATFKDVRLNLAAKFADLLSGWYWGFKTKRYSKGEMEGLLKKRFKSVEIEIFPKVRIGWLLASLGVRFLIAYGRK